MRTNAHKITHGMSGTPEYRAWAKMIERCENPSDDLHRRRYSARGIGIDSEWRENFAAFLAHVGCMPTPGMTLPGNVRWATRREQARNRSTSHVLTVDGVSATVAEWSERTGIPYATICARINKLGWSAKDAVTQPSHKWTRRTGT